MSYNQSNLEDFYLEEATGKPVYSGALKYDETEDALVTKLPPDEEMEKLFARKKENRATYKIEIRFNAHRTMSWMVGRIDFWVSGRVLAGGGDDHMFICGYDDCQAPIRSENVGQPISARALGQFTPQYAMRGLEGHWSICPSCMNAQRNNNGKQATSIESMGYHLNRDANKICRKTKHQIITDPFTKARYPCIRDCILIAGTSNILAEMMASYWYKLEGDADIYMKYHPNDIREQYALGAFNVDRPDWDPTDRLAIYPLKHIIKDTSAGASLVGRIKAFITS